MDKTAGEHGQDYTGEELQEEAVEPHVEAEENVAAVKVCKLKKEDVLFYYSLLLPVTHCRRDNLYKSKEFEWGGEGLV